MESIEQVAHLCQSETEEVRNAARETTLSFGKAFVQLSNGLKESCEIVQDQEGPQVQPEHIQDNGNISSTAVSYQEDKLYITCNSQGPLVKFIEPDQGDPEGLSASGTTEPFAKLTAKD